MRGHLHTENMKHMKVWCEKNRQPYVPFADDEVTELYPPYPFPELEPDARLIGWSLITSFSFREPWPIVRGNINYFRHEWPECAFTINEPAGCIYLYSKEKKF